MKPGYSSTYSPTTGINSSEIAKNDYIAIVPLKSIKKVISAEIGGFLDLKSLVYSSNNH